MCLLVVDSNDGVSSGIIVGKIEEKHKQSSDINNYISPSQSAISCSKCHPQPQISTTSYMPPTKLVIETEAALTPTLSPAPTISPTEEPSFDMTDIITTQPTMIVDSKEPTFEPSTIVTEHVSLTPSSSSHMPSKFPSFQPSFRPSLPHSSHAPFITQNPTSDPSDIPSFHPSFTEFPSTSFPTFPTILQPTDMPNNNQTVNSTSPYSEIRKSKTNDKASVWMILLFTIPTILALAVFLLTRKMVMSCRYHKVFHYDDSVSHVITSTSTVNNNKNKNHNNNKYHDYESNLHQDSLLNLNFDLTLIDDNTNNNTNYMDTDNSILSKSIKSSNKKKPVISTGNTSNKGLSHIVTL